MWPKKQGFGKPVHDAFKMLRWEERDKRLVIKDAELVP